MSTEVKTAQRGTFYTEVSTYAVAISIGYNNKRSVPEAAQ